MAQLTNTITHNIMEKETKTATLVNNVTKQEIKVHTTTEHPDSSYRIPVWVDDNNTAYMQYGAKNPFYTIVED